MSLEFFISSIEEGLVYGIMALGVYLTFRVLRFPDLTVDGSFPLGGAVAAKLIVLGVSPWLATALSPLAGGLAGLVTGILHTKGKITGLLSGILTMTALYSINLRIMGRSNIPLLRTETVVSLWHEWLPAQVEAVARLVTPGTVQVARQAGGSGKTNFEFLVGLFVMLVAFAVVTLTIKFLMDWFLFTEVGLALRATGDNEQMIRSLGVNTDRMKILGLALSNALVAFSGALVAQYYAFADIGMGIGMIIAGLASVIIGEVAFGVRSIPGTTLAVIGGSVVYRLAIAFALSYGFTPTDLKLITAILVIVALTTPTFKRSLGLAG